MEGGGSVIDYVIGNEKMREKVEKMVVEDRINSDHQPVSIWIRGGGRRRGSIKGGRKGKGGRVRWSEGERRKFAEKFGVDKVGE